jgi:hypothetical protein
MSGHDAAHRESAGCQELLWWRAANHLAGHLNTTVSGAVLVALGHGAARSLGGRITRADSTSVLEKPCTEFGQPFRTNSPSLRQVRAPESECADGYRADGWLPELTRQERLMLCAGSAFEPPPDDE